MKTADEIYTAMLQIETDLETRAREILGSPRHDLLLARAHAFAFGRLQGLLDICIREGVTPRA